MTDQLNARNVIARSLMDNRAQNPAIVDEIMADQIIAALRAAGLWPAPWEATKAMRLAGHADWAVGDIGTMAALDWAAMRDAYLRDTANDST